RARFCCVWRRSALVVVGRRSLPFRLRARSLCGLWRVQVVRTRPIMEPRQSGLSRSPTRGEVTMPPKWVLDMARDPKLREFAEWSKTAECRDLLDIAREILRREQERRRRR